MQTQAEESRLDFIERTRFIIIPLNNYSNRRFSVEKYPLKKGVKKLQYHCNLSFPMIVFYVLCSNYTTLH